MLENTSVSILVHAWDTLPAILGAHEALAVEIVDSVLGITRALKLNKAKT